MPKPRFTKSYNIGDRLSNLYRENGYDMPADALKVVREMVERNLIELNSYTAKVESVSGLSPKQYKQKEEQNAKNTLLKHLTYTDITKIKQDWILCYSEFFHCSIAYLYGETDVISETGLNNRALDLLIELKKNSNKMPVASEMLDMINTILGNDLDKVTDFLMTVGSFAKGYHSPTENIFPYEDLLSDTEKAAYLETIKLTRIRLAIQNLLS